VVQEEFEEGGKLHGKRVYLFGCTFIFLDSMTLVCEPKDASVRGVSGDV
jgi:hypothetical protein